MHPAGSGNSLTSVPRLGHAMRRAAMLLVVALLAGCAQPTAPEPSPLPSTEGVAQPARVLDWGQEDCESITWSVPVTAATLQPYLPSGFEPSPPESSPALAGAATLGFRAVECAYGFGEENVLRSLQSGILFTPVLPPAALREERFSAHYEYGWDLLVASDSWRLLAKPWDLPVRDGGSFVGPSAQGWTGSFALDQVGAFSLTGRLTGDAQPADGFEARTITVGARDFALWDSERVNRTAATGVGTWTVSPESWVAAVLGTTQGVATFEYAQYDLPSARVHWPGEALGPVEEDTPVAAPVTII
ncbi:MAG: hypothetical protein WC876_00755 [Candidatus Thermoplasmatota archaeon]|jgi:hypothetical protein